MCKKMCSPVWTTLQSYQYVHWTGAILDYYCDLKCIVESDTTEPWLTCFFVVNETETNSICAFCVEFRGLAVSWAKWVLHRIVFKTSKKVQKNVKFYKIEANQWSRLIL